MYGTQVAHSQNRSAVGQFNSELDKALFDPNDKTDTIEDEDDDLDHIESQFKGIK